MPREDRTGAKLRHRGWVPVAEKLPWHVSGRSGSLSPVAGPESMTEHDPINPPVRVEVTAQFLADARARQRAYEERRKLWTAPFHPSEPRARAAARSRARGAIHDPRQGRFEL
ncbi:MAG TPA: hypothetical protein VMU81_30515 [Acetobacteraceae bacterium]|nr:hypothetical protein [Acetobacteraceae bacterium]